MPDAETRSCFAGETETFSVFDEEYSAVTLKYGAKSAALALDGDTWSVAVDTSAMSGRFNWLILADGKAVAHGVLYVRPLVSKYAAYVEAIDAAMAKNAANGKYSVSVGELSLTDKTFDEMVKWRSHFAALAAKEESGESTADAGGPQFTTGVYL